MSDGEGNIACHFANYLAQTFRGDGQIIDLDAIVAGLELG
jgi:hypothetical protein